MSSLEVDKFEVYKAIAEDPEFYQFWRTLACELKLNLNDLERLYSQNSATQEIARQLMSRWKSSASTDANLNNLSAILKKIGRTTCADKIAKLELGGNNVAPNGTVSSQYPGTSTTGPQGQTTAPTTSTTAHELNIQQMRDALLKKSPFIVQNMRNFHPLLIQLKSKSLITTDEVKGLETFFGQKQVDELLEILRKQESCTWPILRGCFEETQNNDIIRKIEEN